MDFFKPFSASAHSNSASPESVIPSESLQHLKKKWDHSMSVDTTAKVPRKDSAKLVDLRTPLHLVELQATKPLLPLPAPRQTHHVLLREKKVPAESDPLLTAPIVSSGGSDDIDALLNSPCTLLDSCSHQYGGINDDPDLIEALGILLAEKPATTSQVIRPEAFMFPTP